MRRAALALMLAASLAGCKTADVMSAGSVALGLLPLVTASKGAAATQPGGMTKESYLDTNRLYVSTGKRLVAAVKAGQIEPPTEADTARDDFCKLVKAELAQISTAGGELKKLDCLAKAAVDDLEDALNDADFVRFASAKAKASGFIADMDKIISAAENGAAQ